MLIILFGLTGSGKTFVGRLLAQQYGYHFWDADTVLTDVMQQSIQEKKPFTQTMRDDFTAITIQTISKLQTNHPNLVVSEALYKEKNRQQIQQAFPDALFIHIKAAPKIISQRIHLRADQVDEEYAKKIALNFEEPQLPHKILKNTGTEAEILKQLIKLHLHDKK